MQRAAAGRVVDLPQERGPPGLQVEQSEIVQHPGAGHEDLVETLPRVLGLLRLEHQVAPARVPGRLPDVPLGQVRMAAGEAAHLGSVLPHDMQREELAHLCRVLIRTGTLGGSARFFCFSSVANDSVQIAAVRMAAIPLIDMG